jgi:hypothetical protein
MTSKLAKIISEFQATCKAYNVELVASEYDEQTDILDLKEEYQVILHSFTKLNAEQVEPPIK